MFDFFKKLFGKGPDLSEVLQRNALILDVRTPAEFRRGHPRGAKNIPLQSLSAELPQLGKKKVPIITCCASGRRSGVAARMLTAQGIEAYNGGPWTRVQGLLDQK